MRKFLAVLLPLMTFASPVFASEQKPNYEVTKKKPNVVKQHQSKQSEKAQDRSKEAIKAKPPGGAIQAKAPKGATQAKAPKEAIQAKPPKGTIKAKPTKVNPPKAG
jgi:hypothetical protein